MKIDKKLTITSVIALTITIVIVVLNLEIVQNRIDDIYNSCIENFGWFFAITDIICLVFSIWLIFGKYKDVRLGGDNCRPAFSTLSWAGMMFTTSCGAWLIVYGFLEPLYCISQNALLTGNIDSKMIEYGQMYAHFHWGPNAWCIYVPITVAIGYSIYNLKNNKTSFSEGIEPVVNKIKGKKIIKTIVNIIAICASVIAPVISIGTGMPLLVAIVKRVFNISDIYNTHIEISILLIWILIFGTSVFFGLKKGIKNLSNINISFAFIFMFVFSLLLGLTNVFSSEINTIGNFLNNWIRTSTYTDPYGTGDFVKGWTFSYWACYFVYMPLMGVFNAKISKGRTIKEIAIGQLVLCSFGCWTAMATFGNYAIKVQTEGIVDVISILNNGNEAEAIIEILMQTPFPNIFMIVLLVLSFIFLATTMDSSSFAVAEMTTINDGEQSTAPRWLRLMWATIASIIAFVLLQIGGAKAVRSLCYLMGLPLAIITYFIIYSVYKILKNHNNI